MKKNMTMKNKIKKDEKDEDEQENEDEQEEDEGDEEENEEDDEDSTDKYRETERKPKFSIIVKWVYVWENKYFTHRIEFPIDNFS